MILDMALIIAGVNLSAILLLIIKSKKVIQHTTAKTAIIKIVLMKLLPWPTKFIAVDMVPGPARRGIPSGDTAISSYVAIVSLGFVF
jgi:hypothetical protein